MVKSKKQEPVVRAIFYFFLFMLMAFVLWLITDELLFFAGMFVAYLVFMLMHWWQNKKNLKNKNLQDT